MRDWIFRESYLIDNSLFFLDEKTNFFARYDIENNRILYEPQLKVFPENDAIEKYCVANSKIYAFLESGKKIIKLDPVDGYEGCLDINSHKFDWGNYAVIDDYNDSVIFFEKKTGKLKIIKSDDDIKEYHVSKEIHVGCKMNSVLVMVDNFGRNIFEFDLERLTWSSKELQWKSADEIVYIECFDNHVFLLNRKGDLCELDALEKYKICNIFTNSIGKSYTRCAISKEKIIILPSLDSQICVFDRKEKRYTVFNEYPQDYKYVGNRNWSKFKGFNDIGEFRYYSMRSANYILKISKENGEICFIKPNVPTASEDLERLLISDGIVKESDVGIDNFVKYVLGKQ